MRDTDVNLYRQERLREEFGPFLDAPGSDGTAIAANDIVGAPYRRLLAETVQNGDGGETFGPGQASLGQEQVSPLARKLMTSLRVDTSMHIDDIIRSYEQQSPSEILSALGELELFGVIKQLPGKYFVRVWA